VNGKCFLPPSVAGRAGNRDIYGYNLSTGQAFPIATGPRDQRGPGIDGDQVVWSEGSTRGTIGWAQLIRTPEPATLTLMAAALCSLTRHHRR
jgi:hypothetical protein